MLKRTIGYLALSLAGATGLSGSMLACGSPSSGSASGVTNATVSVELYNAAGLKVGACLGTVIAADSVLTAGHCAAGYAWWQVTSASGQVAHSSIAYTYDWQDFQSDLSHPEHNDVAVLKLDTQITLAQYPALATQALPSGAAAMRVRPASSGGVEAVGLVAYDASSVGFPHYYYSSIDPSETLETGGALFDPSSSTIYGVVSGRGETTGNLYLSRAEMVWSWLGAMASCSAGADTAVVTAAAPINVECGDHGPQPTCDGGTSSGSSSGGASSGGTTGSSGGTSSGGTTGSSCGGETGSSSGSSTKGGSSSGAASSGGSSSGAASSGGSSSGASSGGGTTGGGGNGTTGGGSASGGGGSCSGGGGYCQGSGCSSSGGGNGTTGGGSGASSGGSGTSGGGNGSTGGSGTSSGGSGTSSGGSGTSSGASGGGNGSTGGSGTSSGGSGTSSGGSGTSSGASGGGNGSTGGSGTSSGASGGGNGSTGGSGATGGSNGSTGGATGGDNGAPGSNGGDGPGCTDSTCGGCGDDPTCSDGTEDFGGVPGSSPGGSASPAPH